MATLTDPARELSGIASRFPTASSLRADQIIGQETGFAPWSSDFYRLLLCIQDRADLVARILPTSSLDPDLIQQALKDLEAFKGGFTPPAMRLTSNQAGSTAALMKDHGRSLQYLSPVIREYESYSRYSEAEVTEFIDLIDEYLAELAKNNDVAQFVKQAIGDGLAMLRFRLQHVSWFGSSYALQSLREVMDLYRQASTDPMLMSNPDAEAVVRGFGAILARVISAAKDAKDAKEAAGLLWSGYQYASTAVTTYMISSGLPRLIG